MIFISPNGKKLTIYTATVFGGVKEKTGTSMMNVPCAKYGGSSNCCLKFSYSSDKYIKEISFEDVTKKLWVQADRMSLVWGKCEKLETQDAVNQLFESQYGKCFSMDLDASLPVYYIHEDTKQNHTCFVVDGNYQKTPNEDSYTLTAKKGAKQDCIEVMNWIKTNITLSSSILNKHITFKILLENGKEHIYYTPDFTWYFAPPPSYHIDRDSAIVKVGNINERNLVQEVSSETTLHLKEWDNEEQINERTKSRVYVNGLIATNPCILSQNGGVEAGVSISNPQHHGNKQFFYGLLVAFLLSFCSDMTRLNNYYGCLKKVCTCELNQCRCAQMCSFLGFFLPILVLLTYLSLMFSVKRCVPDKKTYINSFRIIKILGFLGTTFLVCYIFAVWLIYPEIVHRFIPTCTWNLRVILSLFIVSASCNVVYIIYCVVIRGKGVFNYL